MRRVTPVKSQEELKSDIFCLKRQLALILDENQLLKVKTRRLENELRRREKYFEYLQADPQKDLEVGRYCYESGANMIYKLQKRNKELEDTLLERELQNEKRYNDMKTMCLYSHGLDCHQTNKRGSKSSLQMRLNCSQRTNSPQNSHAKINTPVRSVSKKLPGRMRSSVSLQKENSTRDMNNRHFLQLNTNGDCSDSRKLIESNETSRIIIKTLESERIADKRLIRTKNAEISRLSAELREMKKNYLSEKNYEELPKSTSTIQLRGKSKSPEMPVTLVRTNFVEENRRNVSRPRVIKCAQSKTPRKNLQKIECETDYKKLPTLHEQTEESSLLNETSEKSEIRKKKNTEHKFPNRPKTRIEYDYDSEVSSDGEEFSLPNNLRNFLQQVVRKISSGNGTDVKLD